MMDNRLRQLFMVMLVLCVPASFSSGADDPLANLRKNHPRLMVLNDQIQTDRGFINTDPMAGALFRQLKAQADKMIGEPPVQHVLVGPRLLDKSRKALTMICTTAGMYRLTGDVKYAERARKELLDVAAFADWNPSHFLDVAEMTNACGIGYDWIYDRLSEDDRKTIRRAIVEKGFKPALEAYQKKAFWTKSDMNWSQVCAGGLTVGALAIADEEPDLARHIVDLAHGTIIMPMKEFAPDGGWDEGPGYWNYATSYNVYYLSAIESALGTDFGLEKMPGFSNTGSFHIQLTGPGKKLFNFADAGDGYQTAPQMFWLAKHFNRPTYAAWERANSAGKMSIFHLLWFDPDGTLDAADDMPLDTEFKRVNVGVFRGTFADPDAWYVAFKGGDNAANHSHLDLGSFVLDALGQRWGMDLGPDDYNLPEYFGKLRYTYFRLMTKAHNTITLDGANQNQKAKAQIIWFDSKPDHASAVIDLTAAYPNAMSVQRGISMIDRKRVLVQDEVKLMQDEPRPYEWHFHTQAKVEINGKKATLTLHGKQLLATLLSPEDGKFESIDCDAPTPQKQNTGIIDLMVRCTGGQTVTVLFSTADDQFVPTLKNLASWMGQ
jgi:hypothetical protein